MPVATIRTAIDSYVKENHPMENNASVRKLKLRGSATDMTSQAFIFFNRSFPRNATVHSAKLYITLAGGWSGTNGLTISRVTQSWVENRIRWSNKPNITSTHEVTQNVVGGSDGEEVEIDVTDIYSDVSAGANYYGLSIELTQDVLREIYAAEATVASRRPYLVVEWSNAPYPPTKLAPSGGAAVSTVEPVLNWKFKDNRGDTDQAYSQVRIYSNGTGAGSPVYDTGKVSNLVSKWDTSTVGAVQDWSGHTSGTFSWKVKVWDGVNLESDWSELATFTRVVKPTLTLVNPPAAPNNYVEETTPPIDWTLSVAQERAEVNLWRLDSAGKVVEQLKSWPDETTDTSVVVPKNLLKSNKTYRVRVRSWDAENRAVTPGDPDYLQVQRDFTYQRDGTPDPITNLTATTYGPRITLVWNSLEQPDFFSLSVDGEEEWQRIEPEDILTDADSPAEYTLEYWSLNPGKTETLGIERVVNNGGNHQQSEPVEIEVTSKSKSVFLVDDADRTDIRHVELFNVSDPDWVIGESSETLYPIGSRSPVRVTDNMRGLEGSISGLIISKAQRNILLEMKEDFREYRLLMGGHNIPVILEEVGLASANFTGADKFIASISFFQSGEFGRLVRWRA